MSTFEDYGLTVADVQSLMPSQLHPTIVLAFCHGIHTCIFSIALYYIGRCFSSSTKSPISHSPSYAVESTQPNRKRITLASIISFLWVANTVILSLGWELTGLFFIAHGTSLETEFGFGIAGSSLPLKLAVDIFRVLSVLVADLILVRTFSNTELILNH